MSEPSALPESYAPLSFFGPDFPFAFEQHIAHPAGLGSLPAEHMGAEVAVIGGGIAGMVAAYELMKLGFRPVLYEADRIGGRLRSLPFRDGQGVIAELGGMRFPPSGRSFYHYLDLVGLETQPFPNPLTPAARSTVIDLAGERFYAESLADLPPFFAEVANAWNTALEQGIRFSELQDAMRKRDVRRLKELWNPLVPILDEQSFYGFIAASTAFRSLSFHHREAFGQVGFGTGGWDTDFPNSILEILRVVLNDADVDQRLVVGGVQQLPQRLWCHAPDKLAHWPSGTSLASLHAGTPRAGVAKLSRLYDGRIAVTDRWGRVDKYQAVVSTCQVWLLSARIDCDETLFSHSTWMAMDRTHYMKSSKTFVMVDRPFWKEQDPVTGRDRMSITLTDRMTRGTYLFDNGDDKPGVMCLSYTWNDDAMKWLSLPVDERARLMLNSLGQIYPELNLRRHIIGEPITVSWETDPNFMGAFKGNLPGHYRYQRRLYSHFMQDKMRPSERGIFLAGDDIAWTSGWADGAVTTAINAVSGVLRHFGGQARPENPGPVERWVDLAPIALPD